MMGTFYLAIATMRYEFSEVIGVFDNKDDARARCMAANDYRDDGLFDFCTIETWELGAAEKSEDGDDDYIRLRDYR